MILFQYSQLIIGFIANGMIFHSVLGGKQSITSHKISIFHTAGTSYPIIGWQKRKKTTLIYSSQIAASGGKLVWLLAIGVVTSTVCNCTITCGAWNEF